MSCERIVLVSPRRTDLIRRIPSPGETLEEIHLWSKKKVDGGPLLTVVDIYLKCWSISLHDVIEPGMGTIQGTVMY